MRLKRFSKNKKTKNKGYSLHEMLICVSLIGVLAGITAYNYNGTRTKAVALLSNLDDLKNGYTQFYLDMKCRPQTISQLITTKDLQYQGAGTYCDANDLSKWNGPYIRMPLDEASKDISGFYEVTMPGTLSYSNGGYTSVNSFYSDNAGTTVSYISLHNLPGDISDEVMKICNGVDDSGKYKHGGKCALGDESYNVVDKADHSKKYNFMFFNEGSPESAGFYEEADSGWDETPTISGA